MCDRLTAGKIKQERKQHVKELKCGTYVPWVPVQY